MPNSLRVDSLRGLRIEAEDDLYDLARLLLNIHQACEARGGPRTRTTVHELATCCVNMGAGTASHEEISDYLRRHKLPLNASIEP